MISWEKLYEALRREVSGSECCVGVGEADASHPGIMGVTGHTTDKEVTRYTRAASQKLLAEHALARLTQDENENRSEPPTRGFSVFRTWIDIPSLEFPIR